MALVIRKFLLAWALLAAATLSTSPVQSAEGLQLVEQKIKAGLLYNFLKYTEWPAAGAPTMVVCLYGADPFDGHLQPMSGRTVNQRVIEIRTARAVADVAACSMLFVGAEEKAAWPQIQKGLVGKDVLTVSDFEGFAAAGGMIEFTRTDSRIGVKINTGAVAETHLIVQDRLLKLANAAPAGTEP